MAHASRTDRYSLNAALNPRVSARLLLMLAVLLVSMGAKKAAPPRMIALVDLARVFENHADYQRRIAELKQALDDASESLREKKAQLTELQQRLGRESILPSEREQLETEAREAAGTLSLELALTKKVFAQREGALYFSVYQQVQAVIRDYMAEEGIAIVLRFSEPAPSKELDDIKKMLNASVVAYNEHFDITDEIIARCAAKDHADGAPVEAPATTADATPPQRLLETSFEAPVEAP